MNVTEAQLTTWLASVFWPFLRIGAMLMAAPVFNSRQMPVRIRLLLALALTAVMAPVIPQSPVVSMFSYEAFIIALQQILIGVAMGFMLQMVFGALVFGGQSIALSMGLGFASIVDPQNGVHVPVVSQYYVIMGTLFFLLLNGHLFLVSLMADSFTTLPVAMDGISRNSIHELVAWGSRMFTGGLLIALPVVASLLLVNLGMGIVARAAPQLNVFAVGFPIAMLIGFVLIWVTLPNVMDNFSELTEEAFGQMMRMLRVAR